MNLKLKLLSLPATLFLFSLVSAQTPPAELKDGDLKFEPFTISYEGQNVIAELGRLVVRENRSNPSTRLIELAFVRLKSTAEKPGYPVVYLDGGPGSSAINIARVPDYMRAFMKLRDELPDGGSHCSARRSRIRVPRACDRASDRASDRFVR